MKFLKSFFRRKNKPVAPENADEKLTTANDLIPETLSAAVHSEDDTGSCAAPKPEVMAEEKEVATDADGNIVEVEKETAEVSEPEKKVADEFEDEFKPKKKKKSAIGRFFKAIGRGISKIHIPGVKIMDRYILGKFMGTYFMVILLMLAVIAMFDVTEKLDAFLSAPLKETLFDYFASFLPYFANQLSPLFVFISVIFFTSKMAGNSEITAILSSGISFRRLLRPYMIGAAIIAAMTFVLSNYIIPPTNVRRIAYTNKYVKNKRVDYGNNIQLQVSPGVVMYMSRFDNTNKTGYNFSLDKFQGKTLASRMTARSITYDSLKTYRWTAHDYMIRTFKGTRENIRKGASIDTVITVEPRDFLIAVNDQEMLTSPQITEYVERQRKRGVANITAFEVEREKRYAATAAAFILTLIGMSLSSRKSKGELGLNIGVGLALSFSYILFSTITSSFALSGLTTPFIAMQIPNVVYLLIAIVLYIRASKY